MTEQQKAKAYDEALERARRIKSGVATDIPDGTPVIEAIFPELRENENEDERIRKAIIKYFAEGREYLSLIPYNKEQVLAWLKSLKQGNTWKPSYEQIKAIRLVRSFVIDDFSEHPTLSEILMELEEQLQKIKENKL